MEHFTTKDTLHLTLKKIPFEVMITGEKQLEFRKVSKFIKTRLYNKDGFVNNFSFVKFVNGYGHHRPYFICEFKGMEIAEQVAEYTYSNGLKVRVQPGDFIIKLGTITEKRHDIIRIS